MRPSFNIAGPCLPGEHYMLPPERRLGRVLDLIEEHRFFTLHAGRQTGKTTSLMWLQDHLSRTGSWRALWVDIETAREQPDPAVAIGVILENIERAQAHRYPDLDGSAEAARTSSHPQTVPRTFDSYWPNFIRCSRRLYVSIPQDNNGILRNLDLCFLDIETTGSTFGLHEIIDIAAIRTNPDGTDIHQIFQYKIAPQHPAEYRNVLVKLLATRTRHGVMPESLTIFSGWNSQPLPKGAFLFATIPHSIDHLLP